MTVYQDDYMRMELVGPILYADFVNPKTVITKELAERSIKNRLELTNNTPHLLCMRTSGFRYASKEVRDYMKKEGGEGVIAAAFVMSDIVSYVFFNIFAKLASKVDDTPLKCFSDEKKAVEWLNKHLIGKSNINLQP